MRPAVLAAVATTLSCALAARPVSQVDSSDSTGLSVPKNLPKFNDLARAAGKLYFGTAIDNGDLNDKAYVALVSDNHYFGQMTISNTQKWVYTEPTRGKYDYSQGDVLVNFAKQHNLTLRCHNLVWYTMIPTFIQSTSWTKESLTSVIEAHIASEVGHFKGDCDYWDVVNEALAETGGYRSDTFLQVLGESYIPLAFKAARAADDKAKLYYNDYGIEGPGAKFNSALDLVRMVKASGAPIDGVGLQGHFVVGQTPDRATLARTMQRFADLGVEVSFTEVDVRFEKLPPAAGGPEQQAKDYGSVINACLDVKQCIGWTLWGFSEAHSWITGTFPGQGDATLLGANLQPKPATNTVQALLQAGAAKKKLGSRDTPTDTPHGTPKQPRLRSRVHGLRARGPA